MNRPRRDATRIRAKHISDDLSVAWLMSKVQMKDGCWNWTEQISPRGYCDAWVPGVGRMRAHRASYEIFYGPIRSGLTIDHLCRNHMCVRPDHLEAVTVKENTLRGISFSAVNARKTHCKRGHAFDGANTMKQRTGRRCRICRNIGRSRSGHASLVPRLAVPCQQTESGAPFQKPRKSHSVSGAGEASSREGARR